MHHFTEHWVKVGKFPVSQTILRFPTTHMGRFFFLSTTHKHDCSTVWLFFNKWCEVFAVGMWYVQFPRVTAQSLTDNSCLMLGAQTASDQNSSHHCVVCDFFVDNFKRLRPYQRGHHHRLASFQAFPPSSFWLLAVYKTGGGRPGIFYYVNDVSVYQLVEVKHI